MRRFDAAIKALGVPIVELEHEWDSAQPQGLRAKQEYDALVEQFESAIHALEQCERYERLIEAAGKMDREKADAVLVELVESYIANDKRPVGLEGLDQAIRMANAITEIRALLAAIPPKEA